MEQPHITIDLSAFDDADHVLQVIAEHWPKANVVDQDGRRIELPNARDAV